MLWFASKSTMVLRLTVQQILDIGPMWLVSLALGAIVSSAVRVRRPPSLGVRASPSRQFLSVPLAALLGALSPFPLLAMVPLLAGLLTEKTRSRQVIAFACASPFSNPTTVAFTGLALGLDIALVRLAAAWGIGTVAGLVLSPPSHADLSPPKSTVAEGRGFLHTFLSEFCAYLWRALPYFLLALIAASWTHVLLNPAALSVFLGNSAARMLTLLVGGGLLFPCGGMAIAYLGSGTLPFLTTGQSLLFLLSGSLFASRNLVGLLGILTWKGVAMFVGLTASILLALAWIL